MSLAKREHFVTASGRFVQASSFGATVHPRRDASIVPVDLTPLDGNGVRLTVVLVVPSTMRDISESAGLRDLANEPIAQALIAGLDAFDRGAIPEADQTTGLSEIEVTGNNFESIVRRTRLTDGELRRFITRRLYENFTRADLDDFVQLDEIDFALTGCRSRDFVRNVQLLRAEGLLRVFTETYEDQLAPVAATHTLIREVERYGSAKADAVADVDFAASVKAMPSLSAWESALIGEQKRYATAINEVQLTSVFRAVVPTVEAIVKSLATAHGSKRALSSLGDAIGELNRRQIADATLMSKLTHVLEFTRNIGSHGGRLPAASLRIACETAFDVSLELGSLFP